MRPFQPDFDETIAAFAAGRRADGMAACERLLQRNDLPAHYRIATQRNQVHYAQSLVDLAPSFWARRIVCDPPPGFAAMNPTLAIDADGRVIAGVRLVNYASPKGQPRVFIGDVTDYQVPVRRLLDETGPIADDQPVIISRTLVGPIAIDGDDGPFVELDESTLDLPRLPRAFANGLEDCRLLRIGNRLTVTASAPDVDSRWSIRIVVADLAPNGQLVGPHFVSGIPGAPQEKNWMPFASDDRLFHVYSLFPTVIVETGRGGSGMRLVAMSRGDHRLDGLRGGSPGVRLEDGWLFLAHISAEFEGAGRTYLHRFVKLDDTFAVVGVSEPFRFVHDGIEFAAGLLRQGDTVLVSFGVQDASAWIGRLELDDALRTVTPVAPGRRLWPPTPSISARRSILRPGARELATPPWDGIIPPYWRLIPVTDIGPMYGDARDQELAPRIVRDGLWAPEERAWLEERIRPGMTVVDVGANIGYFSRALATMVGPEGHVLAIEPIPDMAAISRANLALGAADNVEVITAALGDATGVAKIRLHETRNRGSARIFGDVGEELATTRVVRLDDIVAPEMRIDVMKIDTEGMDHRVVAGSLATMRRWGTCALVEFSPAAIDALGDDPGAVLRQYAAWGFRVAMLPFEADRIERQLGQDIGSWLAADLVINGREEEFVRFARPLVIMELTLAPLDISSPPHDHGAPRPHTEG